MAVGAVVDQVPHGEGALRETLRGDQTLGVRRQLQRQQRRRPRGRRGGSGHPPGRRRCAPQLELRDLPHGDGLGEEHGRVGVVAGCEVDEVHGQEHRVVVRRLDPGQPVRPRHPQQDRLEDPVRVAVLGVHGEEHEVFDAVRPGAGRGGRACRESRKSGTPKPPSTHASRSRGNAARYVRVVREARCQRCDLTLHHVDQVGGTRVVVRRTVDGTVLGLQQAQLLHSVSSDRSHSRGRLDARALGGASHRMRATGQPR